MSQSHIAVDQIDDHSVQVMLPEELTIQTSSTLHETLVGLVESTSVVVLNGSEVDKVDTAGVQLIAAFTHERRDQSLFTELRQRPERLVAAISSLGLAECFA